MAYNLGMKLLRELLQSAVYPRPRLVQGLLDKLVGREVDPKDGRILALEEALREALRQLAALEDRTERDEKLIKLLQDENGGLQDENAMLRKRLKAARVILRQVGRRIPNS